MKNALKFGLIMGTAMVFVFLISFYALGGNLNYSMSEVVGYASMIISVSVGIVLTHRVIRRENQENGLSYGKAFLSGLTVSAVAGFVFGIFTILLYTVIDPDLNEKLTQGYMEQMKKGGATQAQLDAMTEQMKNLPDFYTNPVFQGALMFVTVLLIGIFLSLIISAIMMKKPAVSGQSE
ncbi:MAG: DUF4199 domain-containing protein [Bacteroidia bacterium]|nr:DUF4199 domain-containing protein [Bacteroidia bacterium]